MRLAPLIALVLAAAPPGVAAGLTGCARASATGGDAGSDPDGRVGLPDAGPDRADADPLDRADAMVAGDPDATPGEALTLTQSSSMTVEEGNSVACTESASGFTTEASYYRVFDLAEAGVDERIDVTGVRIGIESAVGGSGGNQPATVRLHTLGGALRVANLTQLAAVEVEVADQALDVLEVPIAAMVPAGSVLVVEFLVPDGVDDENTLYPGSNDDGQSAATYVRDGCGGAEEPTDLAELGAPTMHWVVAVTADP